MLFFWKRRIGQACEAHNWIISQHIYYGCMMASHWPTYKYLMSWECPTCPCKFKPHSIPNVDETLDFRRCLKVQLRGTHCSYFFLIKKSKCLAFVPSTELPYRSITDWILEYDFYRNGTFGCPSTKKYMTKNLCHKIVISKVLCCVGMIQWAVWIAL